MNRQTYPASQSPLTGDISGPAGASQVTVTGIQNTHVESTPPEDGQILVYVGADSQIEWAAGEAIYVNGRPTGSGATKQIFINGISDAASVWGVEINGTSDGG